MRFRITLFPLFLHDCERSERRVERLWTAGRGQGRASDARNGWGGTSKPKMGFRFENRVRG